MTILEENQDKLHHLARYLYDLETITGKKFMTILDQSETA